MGSDGGRHHFAAVHNLPDQRLAQGEQLWLRKIGANSAKGLLVEL